MADSVVTRSENTVITTNNPKKRTKFITERIIYLGFLNLYAITHGLYISLISIDILIRRLMISTRKHLLKAPAKLSNPLFHMVHFQIQFLL